MFSEDFELFVQVKNEERYAELMRLAQKGEKLEKIIEDEKRQLRLFDIVNKNLLEAENRTIHFNRSLIVGSIGINEDEMKEIINTIATHYIDLLK